MLSILEKDIFPNTFPSLARDLMGVSNTSVVGPALVFSVAFVARTVEVEGARLRLTPRDGRSLVAGEFDGRKRGRGGDSVLCRAGRV